MSKTPKISLMPYSIIVLGSSALWGMLNGWLLYFYLPPTGPTLIPAALYGLVLLVSKAITIGCTLAVGYISDRTKSSWGRRLPYIVAGGTLLPIFFVLLWTPPYSGYSIWNLVYITIILILFNVIYEFYQIPYKLPPAGAVGLGERQGLGVQLEDGLFIGRIYSCWICGSHDPGIRLCQDSHNSCGCGCSVHDPA